MNLAPAMFTFELILFREDLVYPLIQPEDQAKIGVKPCHLYIILSHKIFFHTISTFINLSLGVICKIVRSRDHLSFFHCNGIRAYTGKTKFRPSPLLLTNDITFDWFAILWLVKRSVQVNLFQRYLFLHPLTHNMTKDCPLYYQFSTWKFQA